MAVSKIAEEVMNYKYPPFLFLHLTPCMHARVAISVFLFKEIQILNCRDGNGEEREGTNIPVSILNVLRMSPFSSELFEWIFVPFSNNNRRFLRVPDLK